MTMPSSKLAIAFFSDQVSAFVQPRIKPIRKSEKNIAGHHLLARLSLNQIVGLVPELRFWMAFGSVNVPRLQRVL